MVAVLCSIHLLSSIPKSEAMGYVSRTMQSRPCPSIQYMRQDGRDVLPRTRDIFDQFNELFSIPVRFNSLLQDEYQRQLAKFHHQTGFRHYEVREDDSNMHLLVDVPGVHASDIKIQLEQEGKVVNISGSRKQKHHDKETSSAFEQSFTIDPNIVDVDNIHASLADGVLTVSVPKLRQSKIEDRNRVIPIKSSREENPNGSVSIEKEGKQEGANHVKLTESHNDDDDLAITEEDI